MSGVYSMVNVPCLVRDIARHPRAGSLATDLLRTLSLGRQELAMLDGLPVVSDAQARRAELAERMQLAPRALQVLAAARDVAETSGIEAWTAAADVLDVAPIGGLPELLDLVRHEICTEAWEHGAPQHGAPQHGASQHGGDLSVAIWPTALDVVADGIRASYVAEEHRDVVAPLGRPWRRWVAATSLQMAPVDPAVADVVNGIGAGSTRQFAAAAESLRAQRAAGWSWAAAMHEACWALHLTARERVALVAQLHALRALLHATGARPTPDVVAAVVVAVHARVAADVLDVATLAAMTAPLDAALG